MGKSQTDAQDLSQIIPDYSGYEGREDRKKSDSSLRNTLTEKMKHIRDDLEKLSHQFQNQGKKEFTCAIGRLQTQLETVTQNLQVPAYSDITFFERESLPKEGITRILEYDHAMTEQAQILLEEVHALGSPKALEEDLGGYFNHLQDLIDGFNQNLMEREFIIAGGCEEF